MTGRPSTMGFDARLACWMAFSTARMKGPCPTGWTWMSAGRRAYGGALLEAHHGAVRLDHHAPTMEGEALPCGSS